MKKHLIIISFISLILFSNGYAKTGTHNIGVHLIKTSLQNTSDTKVSFLMNALLLKAEITENRLLAAMQANKIKTLSKARVNPHTQILLASYEKQLSDLYTLGYREIPKEIERNILARIQHKNEGYFLKDHTPNPFADIKAKTRYKTLSNGMFDEMHEAVDTIQYYHALLNTKTKKIIKLLPLETDNEYKDDPVVFALSVDPLSDKYPNISPYAYCEWNPIMIVDPDGRSTGWYEDNGEAKFDPKINSQQDVFNAGKTGKYYGDKGTEYAPDGTVNVLNPDGTKSTSVSSLKGVEIKGLSGNGAVSRAMEKSMNQGYDPNWLPEFNRCVEGALNYIEFQLNVVTFASMADDMIAGATFKTGTQKINSLGAAGKETFNPANFKSVSQSYLKSIGIKDIHTFKANWLGTDKGLKFFDVVKNTTNNELLIIRKSTQEVIERTYIIAK